MSLENLDRLLARYEETNLVQNWEKWHFLGKEGIVLGHKVLKRGLEVDCAKMEVIEKLPPLISFKRVWNLLGEVGFGSRFIKDLSKKARPMWTLL